MKTCAYCGEPTFYGFHQKSLTVALWTGGLSGLIVLVAELVLR